ncbi:MAG: replication-associated recombination protein A [Flavobacteriales bacterium]|nr:replication-associated recombination protein A [Flavobacteriales bacterium]
MHANAPLAERVRPQLLNEYIGQQHIIAEGKPLYNSIKNGALPSIIFWGPPGVGKTTLAKIISNELKRPFFILSATESGVKQVREVIEKAEKSRFLGSQNAVLFIDEIHRFNKSQQDSLLGAVEQGIITLIGATTENPSFEVNAALLSRCEVYVLKSLGKEELREVVERAIKTDELLKQKKIKLKELDALMVLSGGDARRILNTLEIVVNANSTDKILTITNKLVEQSVQQNRLIYDKTGDQHYDIISAFIKSMRGSDPNAAVYYLARMIEAGEDPIFIARRMVILASEDIGNANPTALVLATNGLQAAQAIGYPECRIILSQVAVYLATSPKSNSTYMAIGKAQKLIAETGNLPVPMHLRNAPTKLMKELDYGVGYKYAHDFGGFVNLEFLPEEIVGTTLYEPSNNARENETRTRMKAYWKEKYGY